MYAIIHPSNNLSFDILDNHIPAILGFYGVDGDLFCFCSSCVVWRCCEVPAGHGHDAEIQC